MTKRYLADHAQESRPHRPKSARINRLSSPSGTAASSSSAGSNDMAGTGLNSKQTAAEKRAAEAMARYNEVNLLFSSQFPGIGLQNASNQAQNVGSPSPLSPSMGGASNDNTFSSSDDEELAFELNASMGLVWRPPPAQPQPDLSTMAYPWMATTSPEAAMTTMPTANEMYTGFEEIDLSTQSLPPALGTRTESYPFTSPAAGELMVTASPADASYGRSPPRDTRAGEVVEDLGWLGDQLQRNARMQLQELNEGGLNMPYVS